MRIVHVTDCYLPDLGGIELLVADLVARQRAAGHDAHVLTSTPLPPGARPDPSWVHRVPVTGRAALTRAVVGAAGVGPPLAGLAPDVVHAHVSVLSPFAVSAASLAARRGLPVVVTAHSLWTSLPRGLTGLAGTGLQLRHWPVVWTAVSGAAADSLRTLVGAGTTVRLLPNAVDAADWAVHPAERPTADDVPTVVSVMRLVRRKRPLPLARMLRRVRDRLPADQPLRAVVVGEGPQREALDDYLLRHRMRGWVATPGRLDRSAIRTVLAAASVYVAPAPLESFGIAALEARCAGLPVVADARSGVRDFVEPGRDGLLTRGDHDMVRALTRLIGEPAVRGRLTEGARAVVPDLGWDRAVARSLEVYAEAGAVAGRAVSGRRRLGPVTA